jgi:hypothetical protein
VRTRRVLRWLGIIAGVLAILTFLGIANYRQLSLALGWHDSPTDAGVCASAQADVTEVNLDAPAGFVAKSVSTKIRSSHSVPCAVRPRTAR